MLLARDARNRKISVGRRPLRPRSFTVESLEERCLLAAIAPISTAQPPGGASITANNDSEGASISADGRYVVFLSKATNLVENQDDSNAPLFDFTDSDVFLFDRELSTTTLVSHAWNNPNKATNISESGVFAAISGDGRSVVFAITSCDVVENQKCYVTGGFRSGRRELFLYDVQQRTTIQITNSTHATEPADNDLIGNPSISFDGRRVAFTSSARNLLDGTQAAASFNVFLFDRSDGAVTPSLRLVSRSDGVRSQASNSSSQDAVVSADGRHVAFVSRSSNLVPGQNEVDFIPDSDVFLYNSETDKMTLVSGAAGSATATASHDSYAPLAISPHGQFVAFHSEATNVMAGQNQAFSYNASLFLFDRDATPETGRVRLVTHKHDSAVTPAEAPFQLFQTTPVVINVDAATAANKNASDDRGKLFLAYLAAYTHEIVQGALGGGLLLADVDTVTNRFVGFADFLSSGPLRASPVISGDGQFVAYASSASAIVPGQVDATGAAAGPDVFLFDRLANASTAYSLISGVNGSATVATNNSWVNGISADGSTVVFSSLAANLITSDANGKRDVFVSASPLTMVFEGRLRDRVGPTDAGKSADGVLDGVFTVRLKPGTIAGSFGSFNRQVFLFELTRDSDGKQWTAFIGDDVPIAGIAQTIDGELGNVAGNFLRAIDGESFVVFVPDTAGDSVFTAGERFTLTARFRDGSTYVARSAPIPALAVDYLGKLRDRVGRSETGVMGDGRTDGTFSLSFPPGSGTVTSLALSRGDGNAWNTTADDDLWVLGATDSMDGSLLNLANGSLPSGNAKLSFQDGGSLVLFAAEDRPGSPSFFAAGKTFTVTAGFASGPPQTASVTLTEDDVPPALPNLSVDVASSPNPVLQFRESVYTVTVRNSGEAEAGNLQVSTASLPAGVQFASADSPPNCELVGTKVVCTLGTLAAGYETTVNIPLLLNQAGKVTIEVETSATGTERYKATTETLVATALQVSLTASPNPVRTGQDLTYEIKITNPGSTPASDVKVRNHLPRYDNGSLEELTLVSGLTSLCNVVAEEYTCNIPQLDPGASNALVFRYMVRATRPATVENNGVVVTQGTAPNELVVGSSGSVDVIVRPANDDLANSQVLAAEGLRLTGTNVNATREGPVTPEDLFAGTTEPDHAGQTARKSVWYQWTAPYTGGAAFSTYGSVTPDGSELDTLLAVYSRPIAGGRLIKVDNNDDDTDYGRRTSFVDFNTLEGQTYYIAVDGYSGAEGTLSLSWIMFQEIDPGPVDQVVTSLCPITQIASMPCPQTMNAGTGAETIIIRGTGFTAESQVYVNVVADANRREAVLFPESLPDGDRVSLAVELPAEDTKSPRTIYLLVRNGDTVSEANQNSMLVVGENLTMTIPAGGAATARTLFATGKPHPVAEFHAVCSDSGDNCTMLFTFYQTADGDFCTKDSVCFPTFYQFAKAHGWYCNSQFCDPSLDEYRSNHNGEDPVDWAAPGQSVGPVFSLSTEGTLRIGEPLFYPGTDIPLVAMLIGNDGASLIGNDGASAQTRIYESLRNANLIGQDGASIVAGGGGNLIGQGGSTIVAAGGGNLIGQGGSTAFPRSSRRVSARTAEQGGGGWFVVQSSGGSPVTITNTTDANGITTGSVSLMLDDTSTPRLTDLAGGMIFSIVIPDLLQFSATNFAVAEEGGSALVTVNRIGTGVGTVSVRYATTNGSAMGGTDFMASSGTLTFDSGEVTKTFTITILDETLVEGDEIINLTLSDPGGIVRLGTQATAVLAITNQDVAPPTITSLELIRSGTDRKPVVGQVVLTFSHDVLNAGDLANYTLLKKRKATSIASAVYDANNHAVTLNLEKPLKAKNVAALAAYTLTVNGTGTIKDLSNNPFDGNGDGTPRGNYVHALSNDTLRPTALLSAIDSLLDHEKLSRSMEWEFPWHDKPLV